MSFEIIGAFIGISGITTMLTMAYINLQSKHLNDNLNTKFQLGKEEHTRINKRIDDLESYKNCL